jgi:hypothetical protein
MCKWQEALGAESLIPTPWGCDAKFNR